MKVEKNLIEKVANGETVLKDEAVEIAKRVIEEGLITKFKKFAFFYQGDEKEIYDVQDCIIDFRLHGAELNINYLNPNKVEKPRDFDPFGQAGLSPLATI